jgi:hypothetical protein
MILGSSDPSVWLNSVISRALEVEGLTSRNDLLWLASNAAASLIGICDIGTFFGRTSTLFCHASPDTVPVDTIDNWEHVEEPRYGRVLPHNLQKGFRKNCRSLLQRGRLKHYENFRDVPEENRYDLVFIDGPKTYWGMQHAIKWAWERTVPGGVICGHDNNPPFYNVMEAVQDMGLPHARPDATTIWTIRRFDVPKA